MSELMLAYSTWPEFLAPLAIAYIVGYLIVFTTHDWLDRRAMDPDRIKSSYWNPDDIDRGDT